jgi:hypothetical protein
MKRDIILREEHTITASESSLTWRLVRNRDNFTDFNTYHVHEINARERLGNFWKPKVRLASNCTYCFEKLHAQKPRNDRNINVV